MKHSNNKKVITGLLLSSFILAGSCSGGDNENAVYYDQYGNVVRSETAAAAPAFGVEEDAFGLTPLHALPAVDGKEYVSVQKKSTTHDPKLYFNARERELTDEIVITGKTIVIEKDNNQGIYNVLNTCENITKLIIHCDTLIIRDHFLLPETEVTIYAGEIRFENERAALNTTPVAATLRPDTGVDGKPGGNGGNINLFVNAYVTSDPAIIRFILNGANGQPAGLGQDGVSGADGGSGYTYTFTVPSKNINIETTEVSWYWYSYFPGYFPNIVTQSIDSLLESGVVYAKFRIVGDSPGYKVIGTDFFPEDGTDAICPGKPGAGGNGGLLKTTVDILYCITSTAGLRGNSGFDLNFDGLDEKDYFGGKPGNPVVSYKRYYLYNRHAQNTPFDFTSFACELDPSVTENNIKKTSVKGIDYLKNDPAILSTYPRENGETGKNEKLTAEYNWITPHNMRVRLNYAKDAYLYGYTTFAQTELVKLTTLIEEYKNSTEWEAVSSQWKAEFVQLQNEINPILRRLDSNLDYFGNPAGWVPMLSFEVTKIAFENEIDRALNTLYLTYWFKKNYANQEQKVEGLSKLADELQKEIADAQLELADARNKIPDLVVKSNNMVKRQELLDKKLAVIQEKLIEQAKKNLQPSGFEAFMADLGPGIKFMSAICKVCPIYQPMVGTAGDGLETVYGVVQDGKISFGDCKTLFKTYKGVTKTYTESVNNTKTFMEQNSNFSDYVGAIVKNRDYEKSMTITKSDGTVVTVKGKDYFTYMNNYYNEYMKSGVEDAKALWKSYESESAPAQDVDAELEKQKQTPLGKEIDRLQKNDADFQAVTKELYGDGNTKGIGSSIAELNAEIVKNQEVTSVAPAKIAKALLNLFAIQNEMSTDTSVLDNMLFSYINDMEQRSRERLLKYHYYMAKAYEYRLLKPYSGELKINTIMDKIIALAEAAGSTTTDTGTLSSDDFAALKAVYTDQISNVVSEIYEKYIQTPSDLSAPVSFELSASQLNTLNTGGSVTINLREMGLFLPQEENLRIEDLKVKEMSCVPAGNIGSFGYTKIVIQHAGISKICKDGVNYLFRHYNNNTANPITWGGTLDLHDNSLTQIKPSAASDSLLQSILSTEQSGDIMLYSRPSAWGDLVITKSDNTKSGVAVALKSLRLELDYDYSQKSSQLSELEVAAPNKSIKPTITVSTPDMNNRMSGMGFFTRNFENSSADITVSTPAEYGNWKFVKWCDRSGNEITDGSISDSTNAVITVSLGKSLSLKPVYENIYGETVEIIESASPAVSSDSSSKNNGFFGCGSVTQAAEKGTYHEEWYIEWLNILMYLLFPITLIKIAAYFKRRFI